MIPGKRDQRTTLQEGDRAGLAEFASPSAVLGQPGGRFPCSGILPDQDGFGAAFYRSQANIRFSAQTFIKCERPSCN
jgi:hypothetical protein